MSFGTILNKYKGRIIFMALSIGAISFFDILPLNLFDLKENTKFIYIGIILCGAYVYHEYHYKTRSVSYQSKVPSRNISNPEYQDKLKKQFGSYEAKQVSPPIQHGSSSSAKPSKSIFDDFKRD